MFYMIMQILSNIANFNISKIATIKNEYQNRALLPKVGIDAVSFGANVNYKKSKSIYSTLDRADRVGILVHKDVDADALSSGILFLNLLKRRYKGKNKDVQFIINQKIPKYLANIPGLSEITQYKDLKNKNFDAVVVLDCDETRVACYDILKNANAKINIDHHKNREINPLFSKNLRILDSDAVSTTQVIYDNLFLPFGIWPNKTMMECIMTGIITDTGNFKNVPDSEKFSKSMKSLAQYTNVPLSVLVNKINNKFDVSKQRSKELENLFTNIVEYGENLNTYITPNNKRVNYILINQELLNKYNVKDDESDIKETLSHIAANYRSKADIVATLWERKNGDIRLSMRSNNIDVLSIAEEFGGGGHKLAAGATVSSDFNEALEKVIQVIDKNC